MPPTMPQIETIVMLMLENRSLDTMLGWLYRDGAPNVVYPVGSDPRFNGVPAGAGNSRDKMAFSPTFGSRVPSQRSRMPRWGPKEDLFHVQRQLYADAGGTIDDPHWGQPPMTGFAFDYPTDTLYAGDVMGAYTEVELPVLHGLAQSFAVSDRWFSSVPSETDSNRAFSLSGTSHGVEDDFPPLFFDDPTIFNGLQDKAFGQNNKTWGIYWQYKGLLTLDPTVTDRLCFTADKFLKIRAAVQSHDGVVAPYGDLLEDLRQGHDIPQFCYIEPYWGYGLGNADGQDFWGLQGNDYHAPTWVGAAEHDLNELYEALKASKQWDSMLFIISFDEHGGTWDHEPPPSAVRPDGHVGKSGFTYERLGVRVPTLLVSPYIAPGTVFRAPPSSPYDFDHTSFIKTILQWAGTGDDFMALMGERVRQAPTFDAVLSDTPVAGAPTFVVPSHYGAESAMKGLRLPFDTADLTDDVVMALAETVSSREELLQKLLGRSGPTPG